jgi:hypothetical protein
VFLDWEPYVALRYLKKPVDLIMLQPGTHVMTNPKQRLASETTNVDWLRFWLKDETDPDRPRRRNMSVGRNSRRFKLPSTKRHYRRCRQSFFGDSPLFSGGQRATIVGEST